MLFSGRLCRGVCVRRCPRRLVAQCTMAEGLLLSRMLGRQPRGVSSPGSSRWCTVGINQEWATLKELMSGGSQVKSGGADGPHLPAMPRCSWCVPILYTSYLALSTHPANQEPCILGGSKQYRVRFAARIRSPTLMKVCALLKPQETASSTAYRQVQNAYLG